MNVENVKRHFWDSIRPLHAPFTKAARQRLGRNYFEHPEMELPPAHEAIQLEVERRLHRYLHVAPREIQKIVIVGANDGGEISRLKNSYPNCCFLCFEPSPVWYRALTATFVAHDFVESRQLALAEAAGSATFHELPLGGNGSLLTPDPERWSRMNQKEDNRVMTYEVKVSTLDQETAHWPKIDLLWMDVQGAEGHVLKGGPETLRRTDAVFLEVTLIPAAYQGAMLFSELDETLANFDFACVGLGIDSWNFSGNALWIKNIDRRAVQRDIP